MKKIVILTANRAEYGLLSSIIKKLDKEKCIEVKVAVTGSHLSPEFGMTVNEIKNDGINIDKEIEILMSSDTPSSISKSMGLALIGFADYFKECKPDALMVLGDRYETLAVCMAALNAQIPIIHLHGGEATQGLIDEAVRNAITKMSYLHFTSTDEYRKRVIQMGEAPERVYTCGAIGVENMLQIKLLSQKELEDDLGCKLGQKYAVMTFHPVTLENNTARQQIEHVLNVIKNYPDIIFLCTKANADADGRVINECIAKYANTYSNLYLFDSLGVKRYLSALKNARFVIGNSSSGIIEAPSFHIPTINIGNRQKGRIQAESVINCEPIENEIGNAIDIAMSESFNNRIKEVVNPYYKDDTSQMIVDVTKDYLINNKLNVQKKFYDIIF